MKIVVGKTLWKWFTTSGLLFNADNDVNDGDDDNDDTDDDDGDDDGDDGGYDSYDDGDLLAPGHQEGSSGSRPSPPRPTPAPSEFWDCGHKSDFREHLRSIFMVFGNTWEVFKWEVLGDGQGGDGGQ